MSHDIHEKKKHIKNIKPFLEQKKQSLIGLKKYQQLKQQELFEYTKVHDEKMLSRNGIVSNIESLAGKGERLDVSTLSNARHYLGQLDEELSEVSSELKSKEYAAEKADKKLLECHIDIKLMEKYKNNKEYELKQDMEKMESTLIEELWLQGQCQRSNLRNSDG